MQDADAAEIHEFVNEGLEQRPTHEQMQAAIDALRIDLLKQGIETRDKVLYLVGLAFASAVGGAIVAVVNRLLS